jgi:hypothetical protein
VSDRTGNLRQSKKTLILEYREAHALQHAGASEIEAIESELRARLGDSGKTARSYIADVLRAAGTRVDDSGFGSRSSNRITLEPYSARLNGLLQFGNFDAAERCLHNLDKAYREYLDHSDHLGVRLVRAVALKGKSRAWSLAGNPRVSQAKREEKQEIAAWFRVWLQSPDLFWDWLELRQQSDEFARKFGSAAHSPRQQK